MARSLAAARIKAGAVDAARTAILAGLAARPDSAAWHLLAAQAEAASGGGGAAAAAREALRLAPADPDLVRGAAAVLRQAGEEVAAAEALQAALRRLPDAADLALDLADTWAALGERDRARAALRGFDPTDPAVAARLAALDAPATALPDAFVRTLFDQYADRFDANLRGDLAYGGPEVVGALLDRLAPGATGWDVLDLGCGTGLAAPVLRPRARRLAGVDLSPRMVEKARARGLYDALAVGEAVAALRDGGAAAWDLVAAADVLVYIGDLAPLFAALAAALRPGGRFVATVERLEGEGGGFVLQESRRFAHAGPYIAETAAAAGLTMEAMEEASTRRDRGRPVPGLVFALGAPAVGRG
ncbi:MAG TPA: methyltransferase [Alphaproteobacteria bacterium]|nr:methyltransferase [Alphaproteobacteria bacterium]